MTIRVLLFGHYRDALPAGSGGAVSLELPEGATVAQAADLLAGRDSRLSDMKLRTRQAVNAEFTPTDTVLHEGDEVAFLPPMSGG